MLLDNERLTYHTLNQPAFLVWQLCDGTRSVVTIQRDLALTTVLPTEAIDLAVAELAEAGLLEVEAPAKDVRINRRRAGPNRSFTHPMSTSSTGSPTR